MSTAEEWEFWRAVLIAIYAVGFVGACLFNTSNRWPRGWASQEAAIARGAFALVWPALAAGFLALGIATGIAQLAVGLGQIARRAWRLRPRRRPRAVLPVAIVVDAETRARLDCGEITGLSVGSRVEREP